MYAEALELLRQGTGSPTAGFREGQWEAIQLLARDRGRAFLVRRTGWGKSFVYFISTALLRRRGAGPTLIISPLLSLMRNQLAAAERMGLRSYRIDSTNPEEWEGIFARINANLVDVLLVSPERLANRIFLESTSQALFGKLGMLVVDEAHCISDWGHDFRPDYLLIARFVSFLPRNVAMLATTATADDTVVQDVRHQLGDNITVSRGSLTRESLVLDVDSGRTYAGRLAWLASALPALPGSGIIYTLTKRDANIVADWLRHKQISAQSYHGSIEHQIREEREQDLLANRVKALVATKALGMGFDKGDLGFVVHFQGTQSIIDYYQQVGRAGRAMDRAVAVLLGGDEDEDIIEFFIRGALPPQELVDGILQAVDDSEDGLSVPMLMAHVNEPKGRIERAITFLELEHPSPLRKSGTRYVRTAVPYNYPVERAQALAQRRHLERNAMRDYAHGRVCLMQMLARNLGDAEAPVCGRCRVCIASPIVAIDNLDTLTAEAEDFLNRREIRLAPVKKWPSGGLPSFNFASLSLIPEQLRAEEGRALAYFNVGSNGRRLRREKYETGHFSDHTVSQAADLIRRWNPQPPPQWVVPMVSDRHPHLVPDFARKLAGILGIPYIESLRKARQTEQQKAMQNNSFRARNLDGSLQVVVPPFGPGIFVDDMFDSGLTVAVATALLRGAGAGAVYPFTLSRASSRE